MKTTLRLSLVSALISVTALAQQQQPPAQQRGGQQQQQQQQMRLPEITFDEKGLLERLHQDNQREIMLGKLAQERGQSQAVKQYGEMMVRDHEQFDRDLMTLAQKQNWKLGQPKMTSDMEKRHQAMVEADTAFLKVAEGMVFDAFYLSNMVGDHDHSLMLIGAGLQKFSRGPSVELLRQAQGTLQRHRDSAYRSLGEFKASPAMGTGGAGSNGMEQNGKPKK